MRRLEYINSRGEIINFREFDTQIYKGNFHDYQWSYDGIARQFGEDIERFKKSPLKYEIVIVARGADKEEKLNSITEIIEYDIQHKKPAQLWWGDYYVNCYIIASTTTPSDKFIGAEKTMEILVPYPFWFREIKKSFFANSGGGSGEYLDYDYGYLYDYTGPDNNSFWNVDHYAPSHFEMIIYGPCVDPRININEHPYIVYYTVEKGEYIQTIWGLGYKFEC